ncbi:MAG: hypothetical protein ABL928_04520 [Sphingorhabdus sp.]
MLLTLSSIVMVLTALLHSVAGEKWLIGPLLELNTGVLQVPLARKIVRFGWHITSVLMIACAITVVWPGTPRTVIVVMGTAWLASGLFDAVYSSGKHVGWPFLSSAGALALFHATM